MSYGSRNMAGELRRGFQMTPKVVKELPMTSHAEHKTVRVQQSHWRLSFLIRGFNPSQEYFTTSRQLRSSQLFFEDKENETKAK